MTQRIVKEDHVQPRHFFRVIALRIASPTKRLVAAVDDRAIVSRLASNEPLKEVGSLRQLKLDLGRAVLAADFSLTRVHDARCLKRRKIKHVVNLPSKNVVPGAASDHEIQMASIRIPSPVAVVHEHLNL